MVSEEVLGINDPAPGFKAEALVGSEVKDISLDQYKGKWVVLVFYPADFTFVCPTELGSLADSYSQFTEMGVELMSISTDTVFVHKAWKDNSETIAKIQYPMIADPTGSICKKYGTYIAGEGLSLRGTFIIDPEGVLKAYELHDNAIGRNTEELIRKLQAAQFVRDNKGQVCPMNWKPGEKTFTPGMDLVGKL